MPTPPQPPAASTPAAARGTRTPAPGREGPRQPARPAPDPTAIRLCPVPDSAPPFDDQQLPHDRASAPATEGGPGAPDRPGRSARGASGVRFGDRHPPTGSRTGIEGHAGPGGANWPGRFAQALAETLAGARPAAHVVPWTTEQARASIRRLGPALVTGQRPRLHRVVTSRPADDVIEVAAVVGFGTRTRAVALRLERADARPPAPGRPGRPARWLCTAVESA